MSESHRAIVTFEAIKTELYPTVSLNQYGLPNWNGMLRSIHYNDERNQLIINVANNNLPKTTLIIVRDVIHVEILVDLLTTMNINAIGLTTNIQYIDENVNVIVSTIGSLMVRPDIVILKSIEVILIATTIAFSNSINVIKRLVNNVNHDNVRIQYILDNNVTLNHHYDKFIDAMKLYSIDTFNEIKHE